MSEEKIAVEVGSWNAARTPGRGKVAGALSQAQGEFPDIKKDKKVNIKTAKGSFAYAYADLAAVIKAVRPALTKAKLALTQLTRFEHGKLWLITQLIHESGEYLEGWYPLPEAKAVNDPQSFGSALTYAKRYSLSSILGIATEEDDDGKAGSAAPAISEAMVSNLKEAMAKAGKDADAVKALCKKHSGQANPRRLSPDQFKLVFDELSKRDLPGKRE